MPPLPGDGGTQNRRIAKKKRKRPQTPHGPGGQMLRAAPKPAPVKARSPAAKRKGVRVVQRSAARVAPKGPPTPKRLNTPAKREKERQKVIAGQKRVARSPWSAPERVKARQAAREAMLTPKLSPVLTVLDQTTRPLHAIAGAAKEDVKDVKAGRLPVGHGSLKAAGRGIQNKDKTTFSDVLKEAGVKNKTVRGVAGFALDVGLDPTTYLTGGTASVAVKSGEKAAARATKKAAAKGLNPEQAAKFGERARKAAVKADSGEKGATLKFAGQSVPGVTKATAKASAPVKRVVRKVTPDRAKDYAADINPNVAPRGVSKATSDRAVNATRTARGKINTGERDAISLAHGIKKKIGEKNYNTVVDAIEAGNLKGLPDELRPHAITLRSESKHIRKVQRQAGVKVADLADTKNGVKGYVYRQLSDDAAEAEGKKIGRGSGTKGPSSKARTEKRPLSVVREESPGKYREDLNALAAERHAHGTSTAAKAGLNRDLASLGRDVKRGANPDLKEGEAIFHVKGSEIVEVTDKKLIDRITTPLTPNKAMRQAAKGKKAKGKPFSDHWIKTRRDAIAHKKLDIPKLEAQLKATSKDHPYHASLVLDIKNAKRALASYESDLATALGGNAAKIAAPAATPKLKFATPKGVGGRFVVLNKELVERSLEGAAPALKGKGFIHGFDKTTSGFKRVALATPGFHIRNLVGDTAQAYVNQPARTLGPNLRRSAKVLKAINKSDVAKRELRPVNKSGHTLKTKQYGEMPLEDVADMLIKHGAARSGYTARELKELSESGGVQKGGKVRQGLRGARKGLGDTKAGAASKRAFLNREDLPRIATAIHALQNGATWEQAARKVADTHFDYAHLTSFERNVARRLLPFYTWSARNIPFTAKNVIAKPGKYANFQKLREEAAKTSGVDDPQPAEVQALYKQLKQAGVDVPKGWEKHLTEWEQRNAGVPVSWKGHKFTVSLGLPLQDLNEFPGAAGKGQASEYWQKGASLVTPVFKDPAEYFENHSFFFRDQLESDTTPNVAAPSWVPKLGAAARKNLHVVKIRDKRSGKMVWGWPAKMDYIAKAVPGTPNYLQQLSTGAADRRGRGTAGKALAFAGVKSVPLDPVTNAVNLAYARMQEIQKEMAGLRQQGINAKNPTPKYTKLNAQLKITSKIAFQGKTQRKDKVLPTQGGPPKIRRPASSGGGSGGFFKSHERPSTTSGRSGQGFFK